MPEAGPPSLGFGLQFSELYERRGLARLHALFLDWLQPRDGDLACALQNALLSGATQEGEGQNAADLLLLTAIQLEDFIAELFAG